MSEETAARVPDPPDEESLAAFVGRNWELHYRSRFAMFRSARRLRDWLTWNWAAALVPFWHAWRRRPDLQLLWAVVLGALTIVFVARFEQDVRVLFFVPVGPLLIAWLVVGAAQGLLGDRAVYREALRALRVRADTPDGREERLTQARQRGGVSWRNTVRFAVLTALLVLVPPPTRYRHLAHVAAVRRDVRNLVLAQENYFADHVAFARALPPGYVASEGVTVEIREASPDGWSAMAWHDRTGATCGVFVGRAAPVMPGALEFEPRCEIREKGGLLRWLWDPR